jgi:hypothetical protein
LLAEREERPSDAPADPSRRAAIRELTRPLGDAPFRDALERLMTRATGSSKPGGK